ncbi:hypothetical protein H2201_009049 [Coniosporium apollinis]|uniref:VOC domain-containing protein n=1 Tax=Coniosporium apollinis TaxID=61459 RepID=A0ABQ9NHU1_9PEZI|nr:hypothetical protein H2201_009049 [Coniosporium apollinis]
MTSTTSSPPPITHILETCLYVRSITKSVDFYKSVLGLQPFLETPPISGFALGSTTLLLFQLGLTAEDVTPPSGGRIPGHGPSQGIVDMLGTESEPKQQLKQQLKQHFCLAVKNREDVAKWEEALKERGVQITGTMDWEKGGRSVYFSDPDGHVGEIGSRGIWSHY